MRVAEHLGKLFHFIGDKTGKLADPYTGRNEGTPTMNVGLYVIGKNGKVLFAQPTDDPDVAKALKALGQ